jgi:tight adherence protein B
MGAVMFAGGRVALAALPTLPVLPSAVAWGVGALLAIGVSLIFLGIQRSVNRRVSNLEKRFANAEVFAVTGAPAQTARRSPFAVLGRSRERGANPAQAPSNQRTFSARLERELAQADLRITAGEFMVLSGVLASVGTLLGFALPVPGHIVLGLVLLVAGIYGPRAYVTRRRIGRQTAFNTQLPDMITLMSGSLSAGANLIQALRVVATEGGDPIGPEFRLVMREIDFGRPPDVALTNLAQRMDSEDLEKMVTALNIQSEAGGRLGEMLNTIADQIRERAKLLGDVKVLTSQQRLSGYVIALLPVAIALLLLVVNPNYMLGVFATTRWCGWTMLTFSVAMTLIGFVVIRRIVNIKV